MICFQFVNIVVKRQHHHHHADAVAEVQTSSESVSRRHSFERYDVFVNHRGPDVKLTFAAHLNDALRRAGFHPFLDAKSVQQGSHVLNSIEAGLRGADVHVAIFSRRYAESKNCLQELLAILHSQKPVIPVFYDVNPEDLRNVHCGPFASGFRKHHSSNRHEDISKWKDALLQAAALRGSGKMKLVGKCFFSFSCFDHNVT